MKGHHIHLLKSDGTEEQKIFNFESIGKSIEYFKKNWETLLIGEIK
jgi:hypothetical protein